MRYIPHTENDIKVMLQAIGIGSVDELFDSIPEPLRLTRPLALPPAVSETEVVRLLGRLARHNPDPDEYLQFLGAGAYRHFTPSLVNHLILRGEFFTGYTPYQPEVSQGTLQAIFEFQTLICLLTGMEIANASLYDGASGLAEAVLMAQRVHGGNRVLVSRAVHPEYRQVAQTYLTGSPLQWVEAPFDASGKTDVEFLRQQVTPETCAVVLQSPNFFGVVEEYRALGEFLKDLPTMLVVAVAEPTSLGILKPPGENGADIAVGEGQGLGLPVSFGGPYVGFFATHERFLRQIPGRIVGETVDRENRRAYSLTIKTREQDIRREKATSNICTNQGLCALAATIWMTALGKKGLRELAVQNLKKADYLKNKLAKLKGFRLRFEGDTYNEFVLDCPASAETLRDRLLEDKIVAGLPLGRFYPDMENSLLVCATELASTDDLDRLAERLGAL